MMDKRCINHNSIQVKELSDELGLKPIIVAAKIAVWQDKNNTDDFPSANDLTEGDFNIFYKMEMLKNLLPKAIAYDNYFRDWGTDFVKEKMLEKGFTQEEIDYLEELHNKNPKFTNKDFTRLISDEYSDILEKNISLNRINQLMTSQFDEELERRVLTYLEPFGITMKEVDNLKDSFGDVRGIADIYNKVILASKDRNISTLPEMVGYFYVELIGSKEGIGKTLMTSIEKWGKYEEHFNKYQNIYLLPNGKPDVSKIKKKIIAEAISEAVVKNYTAEKSDFWKQILDFIEKITSLFKNSNNIPIESLTNEVAKKILSNNREDIISRIKEKKELKTWEGTLKPYPHVKEVLNKFSSIGAILTGSLALRKQGTVYRDITESVHDLDFAVNFDSYNGDIKGYIAKINELVGNTYFPLNDGFMGNEGESVVNGVITNYPELAEKFKNLRGDYQTRLDQMTRGEQDKILLIDLFFKSSNSTVVKDGVQEASTIFAAKSFMGMRAKDMNDLLNYTPYEKSDKISNYSYSQKLNSNDKVGENQTEITIGNKKYKKGIYSFKEIFEGNPLISKDDKIIWGHPAIGKTTLLESQPGLFIDWDDEFNRKRDKWIENKSNTVKGTEEFKKARNEYMINFKNHSDYINFVTEEWNKAKNKAKKENKQLIASPHMLLNLFPNDFDKVITMSDETFMKRAIERSNGDKENSKLWKEGINETLKNVDKNKIVTTDKFIGELFSKSEQSYALKLLKMLYGLSNQNIDDMKIEIVDNIVEAGHFDNGIIRLNINSLNPETVFTHEVIHALTALKLAYWKKNSPKVYKDMEKVWIDSKAILDPSNERYEFSSLDEFYAALSKQSFVEELAGIKDDSSVFKKLGYENFDDVEVRLSDSNFIETIYTVWYKGKYAGQFDVNTRGNNIWQSYIEPEFRKQGIGKTAHLKLMLMNDKVNMNPGTSSEQSMYLINKVREDIEKSKEFKDKTFIGKLIQLFKDMLSKLGIKVEGTLAERALNNLTNIVQKDLNQIVIKPGVSELFESNPELANSVYEALGLTQENKNNITLYHGTANVIKGEFDTSKSNTSDTIFLTDSETFANEFSFNDEFRPNGVTYTVKANLEKTFDSNTDEAIKELEPLIRELVAENYTYKTGLNYRTDLKQINIGERVIENPTQEDFVQHYLWRAKSNWRLMESPRVIEYLKSKGYDSFTIKERGANNIAVFDKSKVIFEKYKDKAGKETVVNNSNQITPQQKQQAQQLYSQYLDTIFPDSKVKDIVYHGTQFGKFDKFDKNQLGKNTEAPSSLQGFFFSNSKSTAGSYAQKSEKDWGEISLEESIERNEDSKDNNNLYYELVEKSDYIDKRNPFGEGSVLIKSKNKELFFGEFEDFTNEHKKVLDDLKFIENKSKLLKKQNNKLQLFNVILNIKNPKIEDKKGESGNISLIIKSAKIVNDGVILNNYKDPFVSDVFVVFEPEQIHVMGGKNDISGFKDFMSFENSEFSKYGTYQQFREFITSKSSIEIENRLIGTGKIDRVC